ncbi:hypothetical protein TraAM80_04057 [Trypanosoma rangeli]|uniref:Protein phosphatase 2A regulatory subunit n=1 Tax=Trypanosoma rangeli TaxID=5698 RepID=A0A422NLE0_TRYRA|nr:uncharacterized protein TraAM80_04057 [Trypanosoma rangeli]RNF06234.1 hypothetical protein TraAM80_04057 [Trypanosoma rangeli]|eukprot:RNF06234.1 hypothetical protein TraAM80_04057 [Trypanosoma rangeli]
MSDENGVNSPSPEIQELQAEVFLSCRSSRAESEAPHRTRESLLRSPRSCRSSCAGSEVPQRRREGRSLQSSPAATPRLDEGTSEIVDAVDGRSANIFGSNRTGQYGFGANNTHSALAGAVGSRNTVKARVPNYTANAKEADEMELALHHSVPFAGKSFKLLQKLHYPLDMPETLVNDCGGSLVREAVDDDAVYEATGELHATDSLEDGVTRSVVRNDIGTVESCISTMTMCMMPDPVHGSPILALCIGDANGRVTYSELDVCHTTRTQSPMTHVQKSKSNATLGSRSQTDADLMSYSTSLPSDNSMLYRDLAGFHRPPVRKHSHQAYVREMDCLTSVTISQAVKVVRFLLPQASPHTVSYLTANEGVIKLFRVQREGVAPFHVFPSMEAVVGRQLAQTRYFSRATPSPPILPARVFAGCHTSPVQDLSVCADGHSFLSADDLQVFWWNLESCEPSKGVCVTDCRPPSGCMDDLEELVTSVAFSPTHCSLFLVGKNSGVLGIGDLRKTSSRSQCQYATSIRVVEDATLSKYEAYSDVLCSISGANFVGAHYIVSRDYLSLKLWDLRRPDVPCSTAPVMDYISPYLDLLFENEAIFDRFPIVVDHISGTVVTGLYDGAAAVWQPLLGGHVTGEDVLAYYRVDPQALVCEVENGGRTTLVELSAAFERGWKLPAAKDNNGTMPNGLPTPLANRVMCTTIADGGERFALTFKDERSIAIFERNSFCDAL